MAQFGTVSDGSSRRKKRVRYTATEGECRVAYQHNDPRFGSQCYIDKDGQPRDCASICLRGSKDFHEASCANYCG